MSMPGGRSSADIGTILDQGNWSGLQKVVAGLAALAVLIDGIDNQLIGFAIPVLIKEWHVTRGDFAPVVACELIGMAIGSVFAGRIADQLGRRWAVLGSLVLLGVATCLIGFANGLFALGALRFLAGLGVGGALPTATTTAAEFTPARHRTMIVTATITCVPLGGMVAGLFAGAVQPEFGWRALFWLGGLLPIALSLILLLTLPKSPRFLTRRPRRWPELVALLARMARPTQPGTAFTDVTEQKLGTRPGVGALFEASRTRDTLALWGSFFLCLLAVYSAFSWLPTLLTSEGFSAEIAGAGLTAYNLGGIAGALLCALAISRFGSRWPLAICCAGGAISALVLMGRTDPTAVVLLLGLHGLFVNAVQSTMTAVCAYVYPTNVRATGTAFALVFGRLGAILGGFVGAAVITAAAAPGYFGMLAAAMVAALLTLMVVRHHVPPSRGGRGSAASEGGILPSAEAFD